MRTISAEFLTFAVRLDEIGQNNFNSNSMDYNFYGKKEFVEKSLTMNPNEFLTHCQELLEYIRKTYGIEGEDMPMYKYVKAAQWRVSNNCPNPAGATEDDCHDFQRIYDALFTNE